MAEAIAEQAAASEPAAAYEPWEDDDGCWNCGGEGYVYDCIDGCCLYAEEGCELCEERCWVCNSAKGADAPAGSNGEPPASEASAK